MATAVIMPKAGMAMEEGTIVKWLKAEGEQVEQGEPLLEILTDKVNMEVEAQVSGTLIKIIKGEGEVVPVIQTIGYIGEAGEITEEAAVNIAENARSGPAAEELTGVAKALETEPPAVSAAPAAPVIPGKIAATPAARRLAREKKIELSQVKASGAHGEIKANDVSAYRDIRISPLAKRAAEANGIDPFTVTGSGYGGKIVMQDIASSLCLGAEMPASGITPEGKEIAEEIPYSGIRKVIGEKMVESKFTAPHVYFTQKVDLEKLLELRKQVNSAQERKTSVNDYIAKAAVKALQKYPELNEALIEGKIIRYRNVNLGIAVAAPSGLIVPVVKNADRMSVVEFSAAASVLVEKARSGKLTQDEYTGGTFTISNLGMFGIENFTAIINPPEAGILAVSAAKEEPAVLKDEAGNKTIGIRTMMNITLTVDHRVVDGLLAAQFVTEIKRLLENPTELLI